MCVCVCMNIGAGMNLMLLLRGVLEIFNWDNWRKMWTSKLITWLSYSYSTATKCWMSKEIFGFCSPPPFVIFPFFFSIIELRIFHQLSWDFVLLSGSLEKVIAQVRIRSRLDFNSLPYQIIFYVLRSFEVLGGQLRFEGCFWSSGQLWGEISWGKEGLLLLFPRDSSTENNGEICCLSRGKTNV